MSSLFLSTAGDPPGSWRRFGRGGERWADIHCWQPSAAWGGAVVQHPVVKR